MASGPWNVTFLTSPLNRTFGRVLETFMASDTRVRVYSFHSYSELRDSEVYGKIDILVTHFLKTEDFRQILKDNPILWVHSYTAGVDMYLVPDFISSHIPLTNVKGLYSKSLAEFTIYSLLHFSQQIPSLSDQRALKQWSPRSVTPLSSWKILVVGFGHIGRAIARAAKEGFGMSVIGVRKTPKPDDFADSVHSLDELHQLLPLADAVVMALPATPELKGLMGEKEIGLMKPSALLVNLGRGVHVDESALNLALRNGRLAGAILDVFFPEPIPASSPLWSCPNLLISPHNAVNIPGVGQRSAEVFQHNLNLFEQNLLDQSENIVVKAKGY